MHISKIKENACQEMWITFFGGNGGVEKKWLFFDEQPFICESFWF